MISLRKLLDMTGRVTRPRKDQTFALRRKVARRGYGPDRAMDSLILPHQSL